LPGGAAPGSQNPTIPPAYPPTPGPGGASPPPTPPGGGATPINRNAFIKNYAAMVARVWTDDSYHTLLLSDPVNTLAAAGIPVISGAEVVVVENKITGVGKVEDALDEWLKGNATGQYLLWLPIMPDNAVLPGGGAPGMGGACCCCCPCCSCT